MYWSQASIKEYRQWIQDAGLRIESCEFVPEEEHGHWLITAIRL
jgi:hypothetical protein